MPSSLPKRNAATTASAVRTRLIFTMPVALAGPVGRVALLGHHALDSAGEPLARGVAVGCHRRELHRVGHHGGRAARGARRRAARAASRRPRPAGRTPPATAGVSCAQPLDARGRRVDALREQVELLHAVDHDHHLAVEHEPLVRAARAPAPRSPGSSGSSACRCGSGAARRRRRGRRSSGSRRTWARSASRRPRAAPWRSAPSWGWTGGLSGRLIAAPRSCRASAAAPRRRAVARCRSPPAACARAAGRTARAGRSPRPRPPARPAAPRATRRSIRYQSGMRSSSWSWSEVSISPG